MKIKTIVISGVVFAVIGEGLAIPFHRAHGGLPPQPHTPHHDFSDRAGIPMTYTDVSSRTT